MINNKNTLTNYYKLLSIENNNKYPFNLNNFNNNLKDNIIQTKKEIELNYIKEFQIYKEKKKNINGKNEYNNNIYIY